DLYAAILPSFQKIYKQEPESLPFRMPVNPDLLGIPVSFDYFDKIKNPMDLSTIEMKLNNRQYTDPWQYINDVYLMFENAWCYNKRTHRVYKYCTKVIDEVMLSVNCLATLVIYDCYNLSVIIYTVITVSDNAYLVGMNAFSYSHMLIMYLYLLLLLKNRYAYCEKCFNDLPSPVIDIDEPTQPGLKVNKSEFTRERNDKLEGEAFVTCTVCDRKMHQICVSHFEPVTTKMFVCKNCQASTGMGTDFGIGDRKKTNKFTAKKLPNTKLGTYLENRVNQFLKKKDSASVEVSIRVLSSFDKFAEIKQGMKDRFSDCLVDPPQYPYRVKAIFAFAEIDSVDVCFFGMHVQEYGSECPDPNSRRVYIAYLDSVNFFQPRQYRTSVYHEILLGYLEYAKSLGFLTAHIWACPPSEGDDYIFHCHPPEQKIPKPKRLQEWYRKMLDKAVEERVIVEYKDIIQDAQDGQMQCLAGFPYFEGDYLPMTIEEVIK
ncbi:hypothetical protein HELRODRAFT_121284, partial [Helobdella robusta]|uniref:histone acetyltransferase n=1 Tax=Helobdella robusta TaxID=6412 RepID=T1EGR3_HELRO